MFIPRQDDKKIVLSRFLHMDWYVQGINLPPGDFAKQQPGRVRQKKHATSASSRRLIYSLYKAVVWDTVIVVAQHVKHQRVR